MKRLLVLGMAVLAAICSAQTSGDKVNPGSLYKPNTVNSLLDRTARKAGDIVTILIDEASLASFNAKTEATKGDSNRASAQAILSVFGGLFKPLLEGSSASSSVAGDGKTTQSGKMTARMSAIVKQVMPNGSLVIEGSRSLVTNKDTQTFHLSGMIRPMDISPDNTIRSDKIAEAEIRMEGKGLIADRQRRGILTQLLDWLF